jgi:predicted nucleic acid-binding protein
LELVIDTNILFSFFWKNSLVRDLISDQNFLLSSPEFALVEIKKHKKEIIRKTKISEKEFKENLMDLAISVDFVPEKDYKNFLKKALLFSPDSNDVDFFALSLKLNQPLGSNDKILKNQNFVEVLNTKEVFKKDLLSEFV